MKYPEMKVKDAHKNVQKYLVQSPYTNMCYENIPFCRLSLYMPDLLLYLQRKYGTKDIQPGEFYWTNLYDWENDCPTDEFLLMLAAKRI